MGGEAEKYHENLSEHRPRFSNVFWIKEWRCVRWFALHSVATSQDTFSGFLCCAVWYNDQVTILEPVTNTAERSPAVPPTKQRCRDPMFPQMVQKFPAFTEPKRAEPCSDREATGPLDKSVRWVSFA
jgi:hypothetical protein